MNVKEINVLVLAYLGDTIYEDYIRKFLISLGINNVNELQIKEVEYVSAKRQASFITKMLDEEFLNNEEKDVFKRARNYKSSSHPKNCDIITYKYATGLEALIGYLELSNNHSRIDEIMNYILED